MDLLKGVVESRLKPRHEEDFVDRLNYVSTPFILFSAAIISFAKEYGPVSEPLYCWTPAEWNDQWLQYAHDYCFVESTYYVPFNQSIPVREQRNNDTDKVSYYQWLPFILVCQGLLCQMPRHFWCFCNAMSNKNLPTILRQAHGAVGKSKERKVAAGIGRYLLATLANMDVPGGGNGSGAERDQSTVGNKEEAMPNVEEQEEEQGNKRMAATNGDGGNIIGQIGKQASRNVLSFCYLTMKCLFLVINIGQFLFISLFLGVHQTPAWGLKMLDTFLTYGTSWERNGLFPRVSLCDLKIRMPGKYFADYTVQCVLMANFLNEKIMLMIYYWFVLMALLTGVNILRWCCLLFRPCTNRVRKMVELSSRQIFPDPECKTTTTTAALNIWEEADDDIEQQQHQQQFAALDEVQPLESPMSIYCSPSAASSGGGATFHSTHNPVSFANSNATTMSVLSAAASTTTATAMHMHQQQQYPIMPMPPAIHAINQSQFAGPNGPSGTVSPSSAASLQREKHIHREKSKWVKKLDEVWLMRQKFHTAYNRHADEFVRLLGTDGMMIFHLIRANSGPQMASLIMGEFFRAFWHAQMMRKEKQNKIKKNTQNKGGGGTPMLMMMA